MTSQPAQFFLKTSTPPGQLTSRYKDLYIRHHGSGINSVVLTPSPPKFLKPRISADDSKRIIFTSSSHPGRQWGLVLCRDGERLAGWERVEIVEDGGSEGFGFRDFEGRWILEFVSEDGEGEWRGWMACPWNTGHPQLFWVTRELKGELPEFCERVDLVLESVE